MAGLRTSRTEAFVVQPYTRRGRMWEARPALRLDSGPQALRRGAEISAAHAGVVVYALEVAADVDFCGEPRVLATFGDVPTE